MAPLVEGVLGDGGQQRGPGRLEGLAGFHDGPADAGPALAGMKAR
ncbi:hypothetical protein ACTGJ9_035850 [Bradyrhizobium sp. RDM12]